MPRRNSSESRNPSVHNSPTNAPVRSNNVLVATVDPCTSNPQSDNNPANEIPIASAARSSAVITPAV